MNIYSRDMGAVPVQNDKDIARGGIYFHGKLEDIIGYDIPACTDFYVNSLDDGAYDVKVNNIHDAVLFFWKGSYMQRGLIVLKGDERSMNYAMMAFNNRNEFL